MPKGGACAHETLRTRKCERHHRRVPKAAKETPNLRVESNHRICQEKAARHGRRLRQLAHALLLSFAGSMLKACRICVLSKIFPRADRWKAARATPPTPPSRAEIRAEGVA